MKTMLKTMVMVSLIGMFLMSGVAQADSLNIGDLIEKLPEVETGMAYSFIDEDFNPCISAPIFKGFKGKDEYEDLSINLGVVFKEFESQDSGEGLLGTLGVSYDVVALKEYFDMPVLDLIGLKVEAYVGIPILDTINGEIGDSAEIDVGVMFKIISIDL